MNPIARYLRIARIFAGASIAVNLEYRANFVVNLIESLLRGAGSVLGLAVLFGDGTSLGGWSRLEATVLVGVFTFLDGLMGILIYPNLRRVAEAVRTGSMDFTLLKPVDAQFMVSVREVDVFSLPSALIGLGLIVWAASQIGTVTLSGVLLALLLLVGAMGIVYSLCFMLVTTAFWFVRVENTLELFWGLYRAGQFPVTAFPSWTRLLFTFVVPVAFITTVPAEAIVGRGNLQGALGAPARGRWCAQTV